MFLLYKGPRASATIVCPGRKIYSFEQGKTTDVMEDSSLKYLLGSTIHRFEPAIKEIKEEVEKAKRPKAEEPKKKRRQRKSKK